MATITVNGNKADCVRQLEEFVQLQITKEKPKHNHLIMAVEHAVLALVEGEKTIELTIEPESGFSVKVT